MSPSKHLDDMTCDWWPRDFEGPPSPADLEILRREKLAAERLRAARYSVPLYRKRAEEARARGEETECWLSFGGALEHWEALPPASSPEWANLPPLNGLAWCPPRADIPF